ncbi:putative inactive cadmium/zinc-transporting ATPase HMA3 [Tasmannia lanceolata]|uniref:putative inactive cadmium/zinc-transporting ATPase HMA3 n=1 Tax=Tasmannia lanceolata TaxID=3420 RepID=UPI0040646AFA
MAIGDMKNDETLDRQLSITCKKTEDKRNDNLMMKVPKILQSEPSGLQAPPLSPVRGLDSKTAPGLSKWLPRLSSLMSMAPQKTVLAENGLIVNVEDVQVSMIVAVKTGEVIPIDGIVVEGQCEVDERSLTGEYVPVVKQIQSRVWAGTINFNGYISVETTNLADDSAVARMAKLVEEAQHNKSKIQRIIDNCSKFYTPAVVIISAGIAVIPTAFKVHDRKWWYSIALVILVTACPCALILSTPVATFCALTKVAASGILVKGRDYLESLAKIKIVAFDKTGTITRGEFTVTEFRSIDPDFSSNTLLYWISSIESKSSHPMADALVGYSRLNGVEPKPENVKEFQIFPGEGIYGKIDDKNICIGNKRLATRAGCVTDLARIEPQNCSHQ